MKKYIVLASLVGLIFVTLGLVSKFHSPESVLGKTAGELRILGSDVIGSRSGTSTPSGVCFACTNGGLSVSSSYVSFIGQNKELAVYQFNILAASTSAQGGATAQFDFQGSNDYYCAATSTSGGDEPLVSEIQWYGIDNLNNAVFTTPLVSGSSTSFVKWTLPVTGETKSIVLNHLNYNCLKITVRASSTLMYSSVSTK